MSPFQKKFTRLCLNRLNLILSHATLLDAAVLSYTKGDDDNLRYQFQTAISNDREWSQEDKIKFTSAVFEAIAQVSHEVLTCASLVHELHEAKNWFLNHVVPNITTPRTTPCGKPLEYVKANIKEFRSELDPSTVVNSYSLFSAVALGVAAVAATALYLHKKIT